MFVCSPGKQQQLACSFIQLCALHVPLFQHQHPSKYWAIRAQHKIMDYQEVSGKETVSGAASFSFSCVGAVPSQSVSASIIPTIPNIESPMTDSLFVHVLLLPVSHTFVTQVSTTILPGFSIIQSNTKTVLSYSRERTIRSEMEATYFRVFYQQCDFCSSFIVVMLYFYFREMLGMLLFCTLGSMIWMGKGFAFQLRVLHRKGF